MVLQNLPMYSLSHFRKAPLTPPISKFCLQLLFLFPLITRSSTHKAPTLLWASLSHVHKAPQSSFVCSFSEFQQAQLSWEIRNQGLQLLGNWNCSVPALDPAPSSAFPHSLQLQHRNTVRDVTETPAYKELGMGHLSGA